MNTEILILHKVNDALRDALVGKRPKTDFPGFLLLSSTRSQTKSRICIQVDMAMRQSRTKKQQGLVLDSFGLTVNTFFIIQ